MKLICLSETVKATAWLHIPECTSGQLCLSLSTSEARPGRCPPQFPSLLPSPPYLQPSIHPSIHISFHPSILPSSMTPTGCASDRPAAPLTPSSVSSVWAPPRRSCWVLTRSSRSSPCVWCCACCRRRGWAWRPRAGRGPPERQTSPCRWGWAVRGRWTSCTWTSPGPWSSARSTWQTCLGEGRWRRKSIKMNVKESLTWLYGKSNTYLRIDC